MSSVIDPTTVNARLRVVFMGTPVFSVSALQSIYEAGHEIVGVYTQPDKPVGRGLELRPSPVKVKALEYGLPVFQPERLSAPGEFERLEELRPDVIVVVAFGQILKTNVLRLPRLGCVNIHSSLLPKWRGAAPIQWAILAGDPETGITTMWMVERLDAGDILLQSRTRIEANDTVGSLHDRLAKMGAGLILETLQKLAAGSLQARAQDEAQVTYAAKLTKEMEVLDPREPAEVLERRVRALNPWPGTSLLLADGERLKVKRAKLRRDVSGREGQIFEKVGMVLLGTREGALELQSLQWSGKKEVGPGEFLNGLRGRGKSLPLEIMSHS